MKIALKYTFLQCLILSAFICRSQSPFMNDGNDRPLYWGSTYIADGSPYYYDDYKWATITTMSGSVYKEVRVKFNLLDRQLQYLQQDGKEMISTTPVKNICFVNVAVESGALKDVRINSLDEVMNTPKAVIYEVLDSGKASLLKQVTVTYRDDKRYGEATTTRHFDRNEIYYVQIDNKEPQKLQKSYSFIIGLLQDKKKAINAYTESNKIKCKTISDFSAIIRYYNSL